jgi:hypothetical protein
MIANVGGGLNSACWKISGGCDKICTSLDRGMIQNIELALKRENDNIVSHDKRLYYAE